MSEGVSLLLRGQQSEVGESFFGLEIILDQSQSCGDSKGRDKNPVGDVTKE